MFNKTIMIGNLTKDIDMRITQNGAALAKSSIATSYKYKNKDGSNKEETCFIDFNIFGRSAEVANQYLKKGSKVMLEGRLVFEQWIDDKGNNRNKHSLRVETLKMLGSKNDTNSNLNSESYTQSNIQKNKEKVKLDALPEDSEDWPF